MNTDKLINGAKFILAILVLCLLILPFFPKNQAKAQDFYCESTRDLIDAFAQARAQQMDSFEFQCSTELFNAILSPGSNILDQARYKNNISEAAFMYSPSGLFEVSDITFEPIFWAECAARDDVYKALSSYVQQESPEPTVVLFMNEDLFRDLLDYDRFYSIAVRCGIEKFEFLYSEQSSLYILENLEFSAAAAADMVVSSAEEFYLLTEKHAKALDSDLLVVFADDYFAQLLEHPEKIGELIAGSLLSNFSYIVSETGCYIQFGNISWLSSALPFSSVENQEDYTDAVREYARNNIRDFSIVFASDFFNELLSDPEEMRLLRMSGMIDLCSTLTNDSFCYVRYSDVSFFEGLSVFCSSEEEFLSAFQQIRDGSEKYEGYSSFRFVLTESLYGRLMSHDHELLTEMEKNAGLTSYEQCSYSNSNFTVTYYAPEFYAISVVLSSIEETEEFFEVLAVDADPHVVLFCTKELFYELMTDEEGNSVRNSKLKRLDDIMARYGVFCDNYNYSEDRYYIALTDCVHSAGARILYAVRNNCTEILSDREQQTMEEAVALAQEIASGYVQPGTGNADGSGFSSQVWLDMAKTIHDRLCRRIRYTIDDDMTEDDNAIGALLNGEANCDGYSDAFYLVGNLAGLTVSFQIGDSINNIDGSQGDTSHIWNLLLLDGTWRMVDVTWDDCNDLELEYTWFNIGLDRAQRTHTWDRQISLQLLEKTDLSERPANEYSVNSLEEAFEAVHSAVRNYRYFAIYFEDEETAQQLDEVLNEIMYNTYRSIKYIWRDEMKLLWVFQE